MQPALRRRVSGSRPQGSHHIAAQVRCCRAGVAELVSAQTHTPSTFITNTLQHTTADSGNTQVLMPLPPRPLRPARSCSDQPHTCASPSQAHQIITTPILDACRRQWEGPAQPRVKSLSSGAKKNVSSGWHSRALLHYPAGCPARPTPPGAVRIWPLLLAQVHRCRHLAQQEREWHCSSWRS